MVWLVRKSCVETIVDICNITDISLRNSNFTPIMLNFLKDENKWVKIAAYKNLGPFIASLDSSTISEKLFEHYYSMVENNIKNISTENEVYLSLSWHLLFRLCMHVLLISRECLKLAVLKDGKNFRKYYKSY